MKSILEYIKTKNKLGREIQSQYISDILIVDPFLNPAIDGQKCIKSLEQIVPGSLLQNIDVLYIGDFDVLNQRQVQSLYENGSVYLSNKIESEKEFILSLIHETAHAFEEINNDFIYEDGKIEREFLGRRMALFNLLKARNYDPPLEYFKVSRFLPEFDEYLNQTIGYPTLSSLSVGLFISPYAITSLREYFANAFENYYSGNVSAVKSLTPEIYSKLIEI